MARTPEAVAGRLGEDEAALYGLIWKRTVASQMAAARLDRWSRRRKQGTSR